MHSILISSIFLICVLTSALAIPTIDPAIQTDLVDGEPVNVLVTMKTSPGLVLLEISTKVFGDISDKRTALQAGLIRNAEESQRQLVRELKELGLQFRSFWITNQLLIQNADTRILDWLRNRDDVSSVVMETVIQLFDSAGDTELDFTSRSRSLGYNLEKIRVPQVWATGVNGTGVVVATMDTGVLYTHEALHGSYKNDSRSWFDSGTVPNPGSEVPFDDHGAGTMTMGLITGGVEVGVAPGAKWISCKAFDSNGTGTLTSILACAQFITCPSLPDGSGSDCTQPPHIVYIPWHTAENTSPITPLFDIWKAAGIVVVSSSHNNGTPGCSSLQFPAWLDIIAVGATDHLDTLGEFSGQGPSPIDGGIKPDIVAPGVGVRAPSSETDTGYVVMDEVDSSRAAGAHVAGVIALLLSARPGLTDEDVKRVLQVTSVQDLGFAGETCNGQPDSVFPNFQFGHGRIDALAAYKCVRDDLACLREEVTEFPWLIITIAAGVVLLFVVPVVIWRSFERSRARRRQKRIRDESDGLTTGDAQTEDTLTSVLHQFHHGILPPNFSERELDAQHDGQSLKEVGNFLALTTPYDFGKYEISPNCVEIDEDRLLGSGEFGVVHAGLLRIQEQIVAIEVAVKRLKRSASPRFAAQLLKELQIVIHVGEHPNLARLYGACTQTSDPYKICIVLELCQNGNLETYLQAYRNELERPRPESQRQVETQCLLQWAIDIATGMEFLTERRVIHGDLACRNVLLDQDLVAKISDFGLASRLYEYTRYVKTEGRPLPWRWMAIESLQDMRFSFASDVWSLGITVWEIFSLGEVPYPGVVWSAEFVQILEEGLRNERPKYASEELYLILRRCWLHDGAGRPTMTQLREMLSLLRCHGHK